MKRSHRHAYVFKIIRVTTQMLRIATALVNTNCGTFFSYVTFIYPSQHPTMYHCTSPFHLLLQRCSLHVCACVSKLAKKKAGDCGHVQSHVIKQLKPHVSQTCSKRNQKPSSVSTMLQQSIN